MSDDLLAGIAEPEVESGEGGQRFVPLPGDGGPGGLSEPLLSDPAEQVDEAGGEESEEAVDYAALAKEREEEIERLKRESAGRLNDLAEYRRELRELKESVGEIGSRVSQTEPEPEPDFDENPLMWKEAQDKKRAAEIKAELDEMRQYRKAQEAQAEIERVNSISAQQWEAEVGSDEAKSSEYQSRLDHVMRNFQAMAESQGLSPQQAQQQVGMLALRTKAQAIANGQSIAGIVKQLSDNMGWKAPVAEVKAETPDNPALTEPAQRQQPKARVSLSSLPGTPGQRKLTRAQLDTAGDDVYNALYDNDGEKWAEIQRNGFTYL